MKTGLSKRSARGILIVMSFAPLQSMMARSPLESRFELMNSLLLRRFHMFLIMSSASGTPAIWRLSSDSLRPKTRSPRQCWRRRNTSPKYHEVSRHGLLSLRNGDPLCSGRCLRLSSDLLQAIIVSIRYNDCFDYIDTEIIRRRVTAPPNHLLTMMQTISWSATTWSIPTVCPGNLALFPQIIA